MGSRPARLSYYFDEDVRGLGKTVAELRSDVTYPGDPGGTVHRRTRPPCSIFVGAKDPVWIPQVAAWGLIIVTRDRDIQRHTAHMEAVRAYEARMVTLSGAEATGKWEQLEIVAGNWRRIEALKSRAGPWIYTATRTGLREVSL